jgi:hypothetical protein
MLTGFTGRSTPNNMKKRPECWLDSGRFLISERLKGSGYINFPAGREIVTGNGYITFAGGTGGERGYGVCR